MRIFHTKLKWYYYHNKGNTGIIISTSSIKLYIGITLSISLALSICVLFILFMQSVNGGQLSNITSLFSLFGLSFSCAAIAIVPLTFYVALLPCGNISLLHLYFLTLT